MPSQPTTVVNLRTLEERVYTLPPEQAVVAAWRQSKGDWATWEYHKFADVVRSGELTVSVEDFCAFK